MPVLPRTLVTSKIKELNALPVSWFVKRLNEQVFHVLDLQNCGIYDVAEQVAHLLTSTSFQPNPTAQEENATDNERTRKKSASTDDPLSYPELILKVDLSLNELQELLIQDLIPFPEIRSLDVSLNAIESFQGIEIATKLVSLNLSYNNIRYIPNEALAECSNLQNLDLSVNKISSLITFPILPNLLTLTIRHNKLKDLQGLQVLRSLKKVNASKNKITSIIHLCPCLEMTELNVSDNLLDTISDVVASISPLTRLKQITLKGNPILSSIPLQEMHAALVRETAVVIMDGINIRPAKTQFNSFSHREPPSPRDDIKIKLKKAVRESMAEGMIKKRQRTHDNIFFLHKKILNLLDELEEQEDAAVGDTEAWCRYIDTLTADEARSLTVSQIRAAAIVESDGLIPKSQASDSKAAHQRKLKPTVNDKSANPDEVLKAVAEALREVKG
ncbi:uncharacterized protein LOC120342009 [Styela clava]